MLDTGYIRVLPSLDGTPLGSPESLWSAAIFSTCRPASALSLAVSPPSRLYTSTSSVASPPGIWSWILATWVESALAGR